MIPTRPMLVCVQTGVGSSLAAWARLTQDPPPPSGGGGSFVGIVGTGPQVGRSGALGAVGIGWGGLGVVECRDRFWLGVVRRDCQGLGGLLTSIRGQVIELRSGRWC